MAQQTEPSKKTSATSENVNAKSHDCLTQDAESPGSKGSTIGGGTRQSKNATGESRKYATDSFFSGTLGNQLQGIPEDAELRATRFSRGQKGIMRPVGRTKAMRYSTRVFETLKQFTPIKGEGGMPSSQYRIPPREEAEPWYLVPRSVIESSIRKTVFWLYRSSFLKVLTVFLLAYFLWVTIFMFILFGIIIRYEKSGRECMDDFAYQGIFSSEGLEIAFGLSWTTFSTVGYGTISPNTVAGCTFLRIACAIEAFFGILFCSFCSAIIFTKVTRLNSQAPIKFSSPICLTYDTGVREAPPEDAKEDLLSSDWQKEVVGNFKNAKEEDTLRFPVLEFRIINELANCKKSSYGARDLMEASISCMFSVSPSDSLSIAPSESSIQQSISNLERSYHPIKFEPQRTPLFGKVWYARHTLDANSPILRSEVKEYIEKNGRWPESINDYASIRDEALKNSWYMVVTFNAISKVTADGVFAKKVYKYDDIFIGWQFAPMMIVPSFTQKDSNKSNGFKDVQIDLQLMHDILPQDGGGAEPLGGTPAFSAQTNC